MLTEDELQLEKARQHREEVSRSYTEGETYGIVIGVLFGAFIGAIFAKYFFIDYFSESRHILGLILFFIFFGIFAYLTLRKYNKKPDWDKMVEDVIENNKRIKNKH